MLRTHTNQPHCISRIGPLLGLLVLGCGSHTRPEAAAPAATEAAAPAAQPSAASDPERLEQIWSSGAEGKWEAWNDLRVIYAERNDVDKLVAGTERAVREGSPYWADYLIHGGLLGQQGRVSEALATYDAGLALAPDIYLLHNARGAALWMLDQKSLAIAAFQRALAVAEQERSRQETHFMLAVLIHEEQGLDDARPHYQALTAETEAQTVASACEVVAMLAAVSDQPMPPVGRFVRKAFVVQSAGIAAYKLQTGDMDGARRLLSRLIECGVPRQELDGLFGLAELVSKSGMKL